MIRLTQFEYLGQKRDNMTWCLRSWEHAGGARPREPDPRIDGIAIREDDDL